VGFLLNKKDRKKGDLNKLTQTRIGVVGVVITDRKNQSANVNNILSEYAQIIIGRMGIPYREKNLGVIALIIEGNTDEIGAMTGKLGSLKGVQVKTALVSK